MASDGAILRKAMRKSMLRALAAGPVSLKAMRKTCTLACKGSGSKVERKEVFMAMLDRWDSLRLFVVPPIQQYSDHTGIEFCHQL